MFESREICLGHHDVNDLYEMIMERDSINPDPGFEFIIGLIENDELMELEKKLKNEHKRKLIRRELAHRTLIVLKGSLQ